MVETSRQIDVTAVDRDSRRPVRMRIGDTLLEALQAANVPIATVCGGTMSCGMCHVYMDSRFGTGLHPEEAHILEENPHYLSGRSRLACQVIVSADMGGTTVEIAPED